MDLNIAESIRIQNAAASMMKEMPKSRFHFKHEALPVETLDPAFCVPVDFEKILNTLWQDLKGLDIHAITANRYSEKYLALSRELESLIRKMGSFCITKAVLEQQGFTFSCPEEFSVPTLIKISGYHFNKAHASVEGTGMRNLDFYLSMFTQETRWASLLCRLDATEDKIRGIREGKLEVRLLPEAESDAPKQNASRSREKSDEKPSVKAALPASLPVQKDLVRAAAGSDVRISTPAKAGKAAAEETRQDAPEAVETKNEVPAETGEIQTAKAETETSGNEVDTAEPKVSAFPENEEKRPAAETVEILPAETKPKTSALERYREEFRKKREAEKAEAEHRTPLMTEEEYTRNLLLDAAVRTGDRQAYERAVRASGTVLNQMWRDFLMEDARKGFPYMQELELRMGHRPPPEEAPDELEFDLVEELYA